jgi:hypothetical protein
MLVGARVHGLLFSRLCEVFARISASISVSQVTAEVVILAFLYRALQNYRRRVAGNPRKINNTLHRHTNIVFWIGAADVVESRRVLRMVPIPAALKEYLLLMGERTCLHEEWDEHGEWIGRYRAEGLALSEIEDALPFLKFQDTFFYVPLEDANDDPPVFAFDLNDRPTS